MRRIVGLIFLSVAVLSLVLSSARAEFLTWRVALNGEPSAKPGTDAGLASRLNGVHTEALKEMMGALVKVHPFSLDWLSPRSTPLPTSLSWGVLP